MTRHYDRCGASCGGNSHKPSLSRRTMIQAGAIGLAGLGMADVSRLRGESSGDRVVPKKSVIFLFLTGGLSHQDSFDLKPESPAAVRGDFLPIATRTPGIEIGEHLPRLAMRSDRYALVRSISTNSSGHGEACHMLLAGRLDPAPGFVMGRSPSPTEWPSLASQVTYAVRPQRSLPAAVVLPQPSVNESGEVRPGQYAGRMGSRYEAWHVNIASQCALGNGACPNCFRFEGTPYEHGSPTIFETPMLTLPEGGQSRFGRRLGLLRHVEEQQRRLERTAEATRVDTQREQAISVLADPKVRAAFDVENADSATVARYGRNKFGLSILMAYRLVSAGVTMVQVNVGKNSTWDTHRRNFVNLKDNLLPPLDLAVSALLDDLSQSGLLDSTLVVLTGEFGRTPTINKDAGRDHWGPVMTSLFAGAGVNGGTVIGETDAIAAYPTAEPQNVENVAATVYDTLGIPQNAHWLDVDGRPFELYRADPIEGLRG